MNGIPIKADNADGHVDQMIGDGINLAYVSGKARKPISRQLQTTVMSDGDQGKCGMVIEDRRNAQKGRPKLLELFQGTRSISKAFERTGWETYSVEIDTGCPDITYYGDVYKMAAQDMIKLCGGRPDAVWASPVCDTYSVAQIGHHRYRDKDGSLRPRTDFARYCDKNNAELIGLITEELKPRYWFIENPRQAMRVMPWMQGLPRYTISYCQYGDFRQKPTDIWTNHPNPMFRPICRPGSPCHQKAPRGTRMGTQALKDKRERGRIPDAFCDHIAYICSEDDFMLTPKIGLARWIE